MTNISQLRRILLVCALAIVGVALTAGDAFATHFRYGTLTWQVVNPAQPNVIKIRFDFAGRWSYPWNASASNCPPAPFVATGGTGAGNCPAIGTTVVNGSITSPVPVKIGTSTATTTDIPVNLLVTSISTTEDWMTGTFETTLTFPAGPASYVLNYTNCCRISTLRDNNNDINFIVTSRVTVTAPPQAVNQPPTAATLPIITLALNQPASFPIAAADPNGDIITFSLSTITESGLNAIKPLTPVGAGAFQLSPAGLVTWTPNTVGLYGVQIKVSDPAGAYTVVDLLMNVKVLTGQPPVVLINNTAGPKTITTVHSTPVTFTVKGTDPENTPVLLSSSTLPVGATMSPSLPTTALNATSTFNWTPLPSALGTYILNFAALDGDGRQSTNTMTLTVANNPPTIACSALSGPIEATGPTGAAFGLTANVDDADHDKLTVRFTIDGVLKQTSALLTPPASDSYAATATLGNHTYSASVTDSLSNASCNGTFSVVDTTPPSIVLTPGDQTVLATSSGGAIATFTATATDLVDPVPVVSCSKASGSTFPIGDTVVTCTATDAAHNQSHASFTVTVNDPTPPTVTPTVTGTMGANGWYTSNVSVSWATADAQSGVASSTGCDSQVVSADTTGVTFTCTATNNAGVSSDPVSVTVKRDATKPAVSFTIASIAAEATSAAGAAVSFAPADATDATSGVNGAVSCTQSSGAVFPLGHSTVTCSATDNAGNTASADLAITVADTTPPAIGAFPDVAVEATSATGATASYTTPLATDAVDPAPSVSCTPASGSTFAFGVSTVTCVATDASHNASTKTMTVTVADTTAPVIAPRGDVSIEATGNGGATVTYSLPGTTDAVDGNGTATCTAAPGSTFPVGTSTVTCSAVDAHGNHAANTTFTVTVVDTTPPAIAAHGNESAEATGSTGAIVSYSAPVAHDLVSGDSNAVCSPAAGSVFAIGATTVTCQATDAAGNHAPETSFTVTVVDTTAPVIAAHANETTPATSSSGAIVNYTSPATSDAVDGAGLASCSPAAGLTFALGTTTVTCSATDAHGNHAADTTFTVTVTNNAPTFTAPASFTVEAIGPTGAPASFTANGSDLEQGTIAAVCTPASGSTFGLGITTVGCTVTDQANATASGSFTITVTDTRAPVLHLSPDVTVHSTSSAGAVVVYTATATDLVDVTDAVACSVPSGATFPVGTTTVACASTDAHGNTANGSFKVTVTNGAPVAVNNAYAGQWNTPLTVSARGVLINDTDADGDTLTAVIAAVPAHGTVALSPNGGFVYTPAPDYYGADAFTYQANDGHGGLSNVASVALTVTSPCRVITHNNWHHDDDDDDVDCVRGTALAGDDSYSTRQATTLTVTSAQGVLRNDGHYAVSASLVTAPLHGTLTLNANGTFVYVPAADFYGIDTFVYVARNAAGVAGPVATAKITVKKNLAPDADNDYYSAKKNTTLTILVGDGVLDDDSDPNGDAITAVLVTGPAHGTLTFNANGSFVYKPAANYTGVDTFVYAAKDPLGLTDTATVTIRVGVTYGHDDGHETKHHDDDHCDHEQHRNGHFDGDGCEHDRKSWR